MIHRRHFLEQLLLAGGALLGSSGLWSAPLKPGGSDRLGALLPTRPFGKSGERVTVLGLGGFHLPKAERNGENPQAIIEKAPTRNRWKRSQNAMFHAIALLIGVAAGHFLATFLTSSKSWRLASRKTDTYSLAFTPDHNSRSFSLGQRVINSPHSLSKPPAPFSRECRSPLKGTNCRRTGGRVPSNVRSQYCGDR